MKVAADLNNMSWKIRPEEIHLETGRSVGSKLALQKLNEVNYGYFNLSKPT